MNPLLLARRVLLPRQVSSNLQSKLLNWFLRFDALGVKKLQLNKRERIVQEVEYLAFESRLERLELN